MSIQKKMMKNTIGLLTIITGILHFLLGLFKFKLQFTNIIFSGFFNKIKAYDNGHAFWFTFAGILLIIIGILIKFIEQKNLVVPKSICWFFLFSGIIGVSLLPVSGFWIFLLLAFLIKKQNLKK